MSAVEQITSVEGMTSAEIAKAVADGRLDQYLRSSNKRRATAADAFLKRATPEQIAAASFDGTLDVLLAAKA